MFDWLGISAINPWLLLGAAGIASPILIHLLSKRRFQVVDWAAMDFLLDADQRNRRRIRLEHLLLLLLRCAVIVLLALLVARLFIKPGGLASFAMASARTERIFLLDDSPSMQIRDGDQTLFDQATDALVRFVKATATQRPNDTFSLMLTSRPGHFVINGRLFSETQPIVQTIQSLKTADLSARLDLAFAAIEQDIAGATGGATESLNRVVYLVTDLRRRDWIGDPANPNPKALTGLMERLAKRVDGLVLVDLSAGAVDNLAIASISPAAKNLVVGVPADFHVAVANHSAQTVRHVTLRWTVADAPPGQAVIDTIPPGGIGHATFRFTFREPRSTPILVELPPDRLPDDNQRYFVARVRPAVPVLVVDGDPSTEYGRSESFYLARALDPPGEVPSGYDVQVITENQFIAADLNPYSVIFLANVYHLTEPQRDRLEQWVRRGGGLVLAPGDQADSQVYNTLLYRDGQGLMPLRLDQPAGDPQERAWVHFVIKQANHPVLKIFTGQANPFLQRIKFYQWWKAQVPAALLTRGQGRLVACFNDPDASPAIVERRFGDGRVMVFTFPIDADWNSWPSDPSYIITLLETTRYLAGATAMQGNLTVGQPLHYPVDVARFSSEARLLLPDQTRPTTLRASEPVAPSNGKTPPDTPPADLALPAFHYDQTDRRGLYHLTLSPYTGEPVDVVFAANLDPNESDLSPLGQTMLSKVIPPGEARIKQVHGAEALAAGASGGRAELWRAILVALIVLLCAESYLAWTFGRRR